MAEGGEPVKVVNVVLVQFMSLRVNALIELFKLHDFSMVNPKKQKLHSDMYIPMEDDETEFRTQKIFVGHRYELTHPRLHLRVTDCIHRADDAKSLILSHFPEPEDQVHCLLTVVDCSRIYEAFDPDDYFEHLIAYQKRFPYLEHATIFIKADPDEKEKRKFLVELSGDDTLYLDQFMFTNNGESATQREISKDDREEFELLLAFFNEKEPVTSARLRRCPFPPTPSRSHTPSTTSSSTPSTPKTPDPRERDLYIGPVKFGNLLLGLSLGIPVGLMGYVFVKEYLFKHLLKL